MAERKKPERASEKPLAEAFRKLEAEPVPDRLKALIESLSRPGRKDSRS